MQRERWTILQWCSKTCKYTRRQLNEPLAPLFVRSTRIPHVDKISNTPPDPRILEFMNAMNEQTGIPEQLLTAWMPMLDHNTLEELTLVLALNKGHNTVPAGVRKRLEQLGVYSFLMQTIKNWHSKDNGSRINAELRPIDILGLPLPESGADAKQKLIDSAASYGPQLTRLRNSWESDLRRMQDRGSQDATLSEYLSFDEQCAIVAHELAAITAQIASTPFPRSLARVCRKLGDAIEHKFLANVARKKGLPYVHRRSHLLWGAIGQPAWTSKQRIIKGSWWIDQALKYCRFDLLYQGRSVSRPAFWRTWHLSGSTKRGIFVLNQSLLKVLRDDADICSNLITSAQIPTLVKPRPWTGLRATAGPVAMRELALIAQHGHSTEGQSTIKEAIASGAMQPHLDGLNRLSQQAWQIDSRVLDVIVGLGPHAFIRLDSNAPPSLSVTTQWQQAIQIAQALGDQHFYLPAYLDFRGRAYAHNGTLLNYMGKDPVRALFRFGEKSPLGQHGLHWLEVHMANMFGACKSESEYRKRQWVELSRTKIMRSAQDPLGYDWWRSASKPFQALSACFELNDAWNSADPTQFETQLPIQLDGTCNGLQHLVALARDEPNAEHVNIKRRSDNECGDVYTAAAHIVSSDGDDSPVTRCMVKDAVMTFFYGATLHGTLESLRQQGVQAPQEVAQRIRDCLNSMFWREREIQHWLIECARRITNSCRADQPMGTVTVGWTSPLGMPVIQPYAEPKLTAVRTPLQTFYLPSEFHQATVDRKKQLAAIVANFVHSLDAAHMVATSRALPASVGFVAVHDSFWARAGDIPVLSRVLREQFARLHSADLLTGLTQEWRERYRGFMVLGKAFQDSALYDEAVRVRKGALTGTKQEACLDAELKQWYEGKPLLIPESPVQWDSGVPFIGTPGTRFVKAWFPLEFPPVPERGALDINAVLESPYFFS